MKKWLLVFLCVMLASTVMAQRVGDIFPVSTAMGRQEFPQVEYNTVTGEYFAVWEDSRNGMADIYGQFFNADGSLKGDAFVVCGAVGHQYTPHLAFDPNHRRFLVVFDDNRSDPTGGQSNGDIRGIFVNDDGTFFDAPTSEADHTFGICTNDADVYTCAVAYNAEVYNFLAVWSDYRNDPSAFSGEDVYGQLIRADGTLLAPPSPADPATNFPIASNVDIEEAIADVTWIAKTYEFFVVYATHIGYVLGQRVDGFGQLINPDGTVVSKPSTWGSAMQLSDQFDNMCECLWPRVKGNNELWDMADVLWCELLAVWKGKELNNDDADNDVWGQRIGFFKEDQNWVAKHLDVNGIVVDNVANLAIGLQPGWASPVEVDYSVMDDEFLTTWGDPRNSDDPYDWNNLNHDFFGQRLDNDDDHIMSWLNGDRTGTVANTENIPLSGTSHFEDSPSGIAHHPTRNEFLVLFEYEDKTMGTSLDLYGVIVSGTQDTDVESRRSVPTKFELEANYPNPFNPETTIRFGIPEKNHVTVTVYDLMGRKVKTLMNAIKPAGQYQTVWDGMDDAGNPVVSGIYFYEVRNGNDSQIRKMTLLK